MHERQGRGGRSRGKSLPNPYDLRCIVIARGRRVCLAPGACFEARHPYPFWFW
jgi:hypothetical protein